MAEGGESRGWGVVVGLALLAAALSVFHPILLIFLPLALMLLALPPRRLPLVALALLLMGAAAVGSREDALWYAERGWSLVLGAWFVVMVVALPRAPFISRALAATGASVVTAALLFLANRGAWEALDWTIGSRVRAATADLAALWGRAQESGELARQLSGAFQRAAELQVQVYPALLALGSLCALGVGWWIFRRIAAQDAAPLGRLREFRFRDELVWLLIAGLALLVLPVGRSGRWAGANVMTFMLALYALRGTAVLVAVSRARGPATFVVGGLALLFLYPLVMAATLVVGVADTWLNLRGRISR